MTKQGELVISACIKAGTDYIDSTGEFLWVKEMQNRYHEAAVRSRVRIVSFCGFDSIPSVCVCKQLNICRKLVSCPLQRN